MLQTTLLLWILAGAALLFLGGFTLVSIIEDEKRAAAITAFLTLISTGFLILVGFMPASFQNLILTLMMGTIALGVILFLLPTHTAGRLRDSSSKRFDERDIMFARARLRPGTGALTRSDMPPMPAPNAWR